MRRQTISLILVISFTMLTGAGAFAQLPGSPRPDEPTTADSLTIDTPSADEAPDNEAAPLTPQWALNLRRAEIVATGSFPLTLLASRLTYSLLRFAVKSIQSSIAGDGIDMSYAPWFLAPPGSPELEFTEKLGIVAGAASLSSLIALIDYRRGVTGDEQEQ